MKSVENKKLALTIYFFDFIQDIQNENYFITLNFSAP